MEVHAGARFEPFETFVKAPLHDLESGAITHLKQRREREPERIFNQIGVADLLGGRDHFVEGMPGFGELRGEVRTTGARSLAEQGVVERPWVAEAACHRDGRLRCFCCALDLAGIEQCATKLAQHAAAHHGFAGSEGDKRRFEQSDGGTLATGVEFHEFHPQCGLRQVLGRADLAGQRCSLVEGVEGRPPALGAVERVGERQQQRQELRFRLRQFAREPHPLLEMRNGSRHRKPRQRLLACLQPMRQRPVRQGCGGIMLGDHLRLGPVGSSVLEGARDFAVVVATARQQQRLVGRFLDQCVAEDISAGSRRAGGQHDLRPGQPLQRRRQRVLRFAGQLGEQVQLELAPDHRGELGDFAGLGAEPVEPRQQRGLQRLGDVFGEGVAGFRS